MDPIFLALITAVLFGLNATIVRKAIHRKPFPLNTIIMTSTGAVILWLFVSITKTPLPSQEAIPYFIVAGILAPGFASILNYESFKRVRATLTSAFLGLTPFFGTVLAIIFLGERINLEIASGTLLVVLGVFLLSWFRPKKHVRIKDFSFVMAASFIIAAATIISKAGLKISNLPYSGIAIAITAAVVTQLIIITLLKKWHTISKTFHDAKYFLATGLIFSVGIIFMFVSLSRGNVSIILPIVHTQTLFAVLFSWLLLRKHEPLTKHIILGAVAIVIGAFLVTIGA
jgi:drug/metabolite transporter, DME family